jgi:hypothetical protein
MLQGYIALYPEDFISIKAMLSAGIPLDGFRQDHSPGS